MFRNMNQQSYPPQQQQQQIQQQQQHQQYGQQQQQGQYQQQNVQQQQQQQQGGIGGGSVSGNTIDGGSGSNGGSGQQEMNLASVLHYLQSEWRRWERDRNEWEIERAEMRARIALLEGQRRSAENLKVDLLRRVKMLEFALRQERTKTVSSSSGKAGGIPPSKLASLQQDEDSRSSGSKDDNKEGSGSEGSQEDLAEGSSMQPTKLNGIHPAAMSKSITGIPFRQSTQDSNNSSLGSASAWKNIGTTQRDPKSRARSREYLKQCLQEISYLTSPGALNPLPPRPPIDTNYQASEPSANNEQGQGQIQAQVEPLDRPIKSLPERSIPSIFNNPKNASQDNQQSNLPNGSASSSSSSSTTSTSGSEQVQHGNHSTSQPQPQPQSSDMSLDPTAKPPSSPAPRTLSLPSSSDPSIQGEPPKPSLINQDQEQEPSNGEDDQGKQILTAIYRPDSKAAWREELKNANEMAEKAKEDRKTPSSSSDEDQLSSLTLNVDDEESTKTEDSTSTNGNGQEDKVWKTRRTLKSHLDIVRAVAFAHGPGVVLATGGDDCTVKVWGVDVAGVMSQKPSAQEIEPIMTYRGHTSSITSLVISSSLGIIFSGSLDSTIKLWKLPSNINNHDQYSNYNQDESLIQTLEGHTDSIWDLILIPSSSSSTTSKASGNGGEDKLISASSDGTIKIWSSSSSNDKSTQKKWKLKSSFGTTLFNKSIGEIPTCLENCNSDYGNIYIGTNKGRVLLINTNSEDNAEEEGKILQVFGKESDDSNAQINAILSHPTLPAIATGGEDGYIRFYDIKSSSSAPTHSILAHPSAITSISISPSSPTCILTSSIDCSIRLWDLSKKTCLQDLLGHRERSGEGVNMVSSHPELPIIGTAGADGVVRLWGSG
ncbi:uncharacterized protein L201_004474 [Kwoniella dendrophila CBS 6074]|uniref:Striatin N-terminal domain-containing protein n=1 Tax=Kwoniella dendrophila CBS 6074 TaxID=1295534 RepID=A0AAX4JYC0_9TREE